MLSVRKYRVVHLISSAAVVAGCCFAQSIQKLDPALDQLIDTNSTVERIATGFNKWTEGPVWTHAQSLMFAEIPANSIIQWLPGKTASVFLHPSGYKGSAPFTGPEPGSNGMTVDSQGRLTVAGHAQRDVWRMEKLDPKAKITILADSFGGKPLNSPNDLAYKSDGSLYFTDPPYGLPTQSDQGPGEEADGKRRLSNSRCRDQAAGAAPARDRLQLLIKDLPRPNGIAFSPDEKVLYVSNSGPPKWMRYSVQADGSVTDGKLFFDASGEKGVGGPGRHQGRSVGQCLGLRSRRCLDSLARGQAPRNDSSPRTSRQRCMGRRRRQNLVYHRQHQRLSHPD